MPFLAIIFLLMLLVDARADGAVVIGSRVLDVRAFIVSQQSDYARAVDAALKICYPNASECKNQYLFQNSCVSVVASTRSSKNYYIGESATITRAEASALLKCAAIHSDSTCQQIASECDGSPASNQVSEVVLSREAAPAPASPAFQVTSPSFTMPSFTISMPFDQNKALGIAFAIFAFFLGMYAQSVFGLFPLKKAATLVSQKPAEQPQQRATDKVEPDVPANLPPKLKVINAPGASAAMSTAQQYLEKIAADTGNREARQWLKFAASYAAQARDLDPSASLTADGGGYVTIDHMTARILFIEGVLDYGVDDKKAAASLEKAIAYYPDGDFYRFLAKTYARLH